MRSDIGGSLAWARVLALTSGVALLLGCGSSGNGNLFSDGKGAGGTRMGGGAGAELRGGGTSQSGGTGGGTATGGDTSEGGTPSAGANATGGSIPTVSGGREGSSGGAASSSGGVPSGSGGGDGAAGSSGSGGCLVGPETCDGVDNDCNSVIDGSKACASHCRGFLAEGRSYMVCTAPSPQSSVEVFCEAEGMRPVWIESALENTALTEAISELTSADTGAALLEVFLGATDVEVEGSWHWIGGDPFWSGSASGMPLGSAYSNWGPSRPNNSGGGAVGGEDCAVLIVGANSSSGEPGEWNDAPCAELHGFVCERPE